MNPLIIPFPGNEEIAMGLAPLLHADSGRIETRQFPDLETYLRIIDEVAGRDVIFVCTLDRPNQKLLPLLFAAATCRELRTKRIGLIAPYLAYMRQDTRFNSGEAITSREVAALISSKFDWLVTVDPHLHRYASLSDLYSIPCGVGHAAPLIAKWIRDNVADAVIIGPDSESKQWVSQVAHEAQFPFTIFDKERHGDRDVTVSIRDPLDLSGRTPVLVDDIISSGKTMIAAVRGLVTATSNRPICIGIHGIFADKSDEALKAAGAKVVTCNGIRHSTNTIDVSAILGKAAMHLL